MEKQSRICVWMFLLVAILVFPSSGKQLLREPDTPPSNALDNAVPTAPSTLSVKIQSTPLETTPAPAAQGGHTATYTPPPLHVTAGSRTTANITVLKGQKPEQKSDGLPYWIYIVIGIAVVVIISVLVGILYSRFLKWKDHGSYMVWDETDLETSPAFTRESEFLLDNLTAEQELANSELQQYEIPLDSISHTQVYVSSTKKVAPKRPSRDEKGTPKTTKEQKKKEGQYNCPSLTKFTKRGTVYNSVTDTCMTSVMSEGTINGDITLSGNTLAALSNPALDNYGSLRNESSPFSAMGTLSPKSTLSQRLYGSHMTRSTSNLLTPTPTTPLSRRFSKSMDKLRLFHTLPEMKPKKGRKRPLPELPLNQPSLVKSASFGCNVNKIVNNNNYNATSPVPTWHRKMSLDAQPKSPPQESLVKSLLLAHRFSKSLDTLLLVRNIERTPIDIDIYHSYESVKGREAKEVEYACVDDSQPASPSTSESSRGSEVRNTTSVDNSENVYASVSDSGENTDDEENSLGVSGNPHKENAFTLSKVQYGSPPPQSSPPPCSPTSENSPSEIPIDLGDSPIERTLTMSSTSSTPASPYACVRISQIPGLTTLERLYDQEEHGTSTENSGNSVEPPEHSGSSLGMAGPELQLNSARSSTHTYLELFPDEENADCGVDHTDNLGSSLGMTEAGVRPDSARSSMHTYLELFPSEEDSGNCEDSTENSESTLGNDLLHNSARSSTHTYLELFPDEEGNRDSVISETSSGYARPVDLLPVVKWVEGDTVQEIGPGCDADSRNRDVQKIDPIKSVFKVTNGDAQETDSRKGTFQESRKSLTDFQIPIDTRNPFQTLDRKGGYDNPGQASDDDEKETTRGKAPEPIYENTKDGQCGSAVYENSNVALEAVTSEGVGLAQVKVRRAGDVRRERGEDESVV
ncbi:uncharacterized protein LOC5520139 [Nematostella vectensis]|uniref:uncharacterized protein LOC5520139 n=1 Tax=Nematostella vectensis TaxID=45351 RepID=UPI00207796AF|nr:uncharacterized protein LOC5520139 [Nematostella vectensis]